MSQITFKPSQLYEHIDPKISTIKFGHNYVTQGTICLIISQ